MGGMDIYNKRCTRLTHKVKKRKSERKSIRVFQSDMDYIFLHIFLGRDYNHSSRFLVVDMHRYLHCIYYFQSFLKMEYRKIANCLNLQKTTLQCVCLLYTHTYPPIKRGMPPQLSLS